MGKDVTAHAILEDVELPLTWGSFKVTIEAKAVYFRYSSKSHTLRQDQIDVWSADGAGLNYHTMPHDFQQMILREFKRDLELQETSDV